MTTKRLIVPFIAGVLVLAACETEETERAGGAVEDTMAADTAADTAAASAGADAGDELGPTPGELSPINRSGVRGTARVERDGDELRVVVEAEGLEAGGEYAAQVHEGRCTDAGPVVLDAGVLAGGDGGSGSLEFRGGSAELLDEGDVSVQVTGPAGEAVACADAESE